jgi:hypothetical protein
MHLVMLLCWLWLVVRRPQQKLSSEKKKVYRKARRASADVAPIFYIGG